MANELVSVRGVTLGYGVAQFVEQLDAHFSLSSLEVAVMGRFGMIGTGRRPRSEDYDIARGCLRRVGIAQFVKALGNYGK